MEIFYDYQTFTLQKFGGISRYYANLINGVNASPLNNAKIGMLYNTNNYLSSYNFLLNSNLGARFFKTKPSRIDKWNKQYSRFLIGNNNFDLLHPTDFNPYFLRGLKKPYVVTVHDMIYELFPQYYEKEDPTSAFKKKTTGEAEGIIAISETTKQDLIDITGISPDRIKVIYHGIQQAPLNSKPTIDISKKFLLFVGTRSVYKNFGMFLKCFADLATKYKELHLVCAGGGAFNADEFSSIKQLHLSDKLIQFTASDEELSSLYSNAIALVFPSKYEGFGYPIIEAFRAGCPVVASNISAFLEVGGQAVQYFDPDDLHSIYTSVQTVINDSELRSAKIDQGYARLLKFPLEKEVDETIEFYRQIVNQRGG